MRELSQEPIAWKNYDSSSLPKLLLHDEWSFRLGLSLLSGIDPKNSELFYPALYYNIPYDEFLAFATETGAALNVVRYWKIQLLAESSNTGRKTWYENSDEYHQACRNWELTRAEHPHTGFDESLEELDKQHFNAAKCLEELTEIFLSNPEYDENLTAAPSFFVGWAKAKHIEIPWLEWAHARGFKDCISPAKDSCPLDLDKRERDTLDALVGALLHALEIDPEERGATARVVGLTEDYGAPIQKTTISNVIRRIGSAKESVQDRKRR